VLLQHRDHAAVAQQPPRRFRGLMDPHKRASRDVAYRADISS
jgi:hypothetical protein